MPEFLELLETIRAEEASVSRLYQNDGAAIRSMRRGPEYMRRLVEATKLIADVFDGRKPVSRLQEAMTTSDFPYLFGDVLDRQLLGAYREYPSVWRTYAQMRTVSDFRTVKDLYVNGGEAVLEEVPQQSEYPGAALDDGYYSYAVKKYGRVMSFAWETIINDDLDALKDTPARFGRAARRSEDKFATQLHVGASGPHGSVYTSGNANIVTSNPVLSVAGLQTAMTVLGAMKDADGEPIFIESMTLEVPPALEITAQNILNAIQISIDQNASAGTVNQNVVTQNWMRARLSLAVNPYIPIVASSSNGNTSWFVHGKSPDRPAFKIAFLRGHIEPEVFIKAPNASRVGGGLDAMAGDFDTDSVEYKVRHVFGGSVIDPKMTVGSNGSGS
jgi:hypothetical protein